MIHAGNIIKIKTEKLYVIKAKHIDLQKIFTRLKREATNQEKILVKACLMKTWY